jgi:hypothetical protein
MANINQFKARLGGGVRPNLFEVVINFPQLNFNLASAGSDNGDLVRASKFLCRSAALPGHTQGLIEVPFRGRFLKIPGDRTFEAWTATFYNTQDFDLRAAFEQWINYGNKVDENLGTMNFGGETGFNTGRSYFQDIFVKQKSKDSKDSTGGTDRNKTLRSYKLIGAWPTSVGAINLAYDSNDAIEEFDVEFQYQYLDAGDEDKETELSTLIETQ